MSPNLLEQFGYLPSYLGGHVGLTGLALLAGIMLSLPLALLVVRSQRWSFWVVTAASVIQTVPSLALLALMVPLLGAFGFLPALIALVLYSMLPILRNTITAIRQVDPDLTEAARGLGMTELQVLRLVELPLALPVIVAGIRTSAVWVVGIATLSTPVGQTSLGNYIFGGLQTRNWTAVLFGCVAAALLAIAIDLLLALSEQGVRDRRRSKLAAAGAGLALVFLGGAFAPDIASSSILRRATGGDVGSFGARHEARPSSAAHPLGPIVVGAKTFSEQYILSSLIAARLSAAGLEVQRAESLGSTIAFDALKKNEIDVYVDYSGTLWENALKRSDPAPPWRVLVELSGYLAEAHGIRNLGPLGFENAYALAMRRDRAESSQIRTIADLGRHAPEFELGSDYEFFQRREWPRLRDVYDLSFKDTVSFDSAFMYQAVREGRVDVITAFSSDGRIAAFDLVVLEDPLRAFPPYDAILLLSPRVAADGRVVSALAPLIDAIPVELMRSANLMVDREEDKRTPFEAAAWLDGQIRAAAASEPPIGSSVRSARGSEY